MSLDVDVVPFLITTLRLGVGTGPGMWRSVKYGEQFSVAQAPEMWLLNASAQWPMKAGSNVEQDDWFFDARILFPFANDQQNAEKQIAACFEPLRSLFRQHLKIGNPTRIAWARPMSASWSWTVVNNVTYRMASVRITVREKYGVTVTA
jgi:hypothetical protein